MDHFEALNISQLTCTEIQWELKNKGNVRSKGRYIGGISKFQQFSFLGGCIWGH